MFNMTYDFFKNNQSRSLVRKASNTKLFSKHFTKKNCLAWYKSGARTNGVYKVHVGVERSVYCIMQGDDGGGWMIFLRRYDGSVSFRHPTWSPYKEGFGSASGEYWLGNEALHQVTSRTPHDMLVVATSYNSKTMKTRLKNFRISSEKDAYEMDYDSYYPGDSSFRFLPVHPCKFTTLDRDNDNKTDQNCANRFGCGWWFGQCSNDQMNGHYVKPADNMDPRDGILWIDWKKINGDFVIIKEAMLMVRPTEN